MKWLRVTVGDKNSRGVTLEHAKNKDVVFHVLLTSPMYCRHLLLLCSLWHNSGHWYRYCFSQKELRHFCLVSGAGRLTNNWHGRKRPNKPFFNHSSCFHCKTFVALCQYLCQHWQLDILCGFAVCNFKGSAEVCGFRGQQHSKKD